MKSACLVCKQLNAIATPYLYRKMEITGVFLDSDRFTAAIMPGNRGLPNVKTVRIVHPYPRSARIGRAACRLLSTIPRDTLTRFEYIHLIPLLHANADSSPRLPVPTTPRVARKIFGCVRRKQRKVDNHQYDSICLRDRYGKREAFTADIHYLARLKHLRFCLWEETDSQQAKIVLDSMHELTSLDVDLREACYTANPILLNLVFRAFSMDYQRPCIRSLRLDGVDFLSYGDTFPRLLGVRNLMLTALSVDLTTLAIEEHDDGGNSEGFNDDANDFVRSLSSPERVSLTLDSAFFLAHVIHDWSAVLDWTTLHKCAPFLRSLKVQYHSLSPPFPCDESVSDFRHFCKNASSLEQLSMSGINMSTDKSSGDKYIHGSLDQFLVSHHLTLLLEGVITNKHVQDCVRTASALVVLKLTVWVDCGTVPLNNDLSTEAYVKEVQKLAQRRGYLVKRMADKILSTLASDCPRLKVVVIEAACQYGRVNYAFLKSTQIDLYGHTTIVGMLVEPHMVKHYEPCSDILEPDRFVFA
jgi:hypothetical protein